MDNPFGFDAVPDFVKYRRDIEEKNGRVIHGSATHPRRDENRVWWCSAGAIKVMLAIGTYESVVEFDSRAYGGTPHCCFEHAEQDLFM
jgi:hypothetical protein